MGVSVTYRSTNDVTDAVRDAIVRDAGRVNDTRDWWGEGINFFDDRAHPGALTGDTKIFVSEADPDEDSLMAALDLEFLVAQLEAWSKAHRVDWTILLDGGEIGSIQNGRADEDLRNAIAMLRELTPLEESERDAIRRKYRT